MNTTKIPYEFHLVFIWQWTILICHIDGICNPYEYNGYMKSIWASYGNATGANSDALSRRPCERSSETDCQQCRRATPALAAAPVSCEALPSERSKLLCPHPFAFYRFTHKLTRLQTRPLPLRPLTLHLTTWRYRPHRSKGVKLTPLLPHPPLKLGRRF